MVLACVLFGAAILLGAGGYLAFVDRRHELLPVDHIAVHGAFAVTEFVTLVALTLASR